MTGRPERAPRYLFDAPPTLTVASAPLVAVESDVIDLSDRNPHRLPVHHAADPGEHDCGARIRAHCHGCGRDLVLCQVTAGEMAALKRGGWTCSPMCGRQP